MKQFRIYSLFLILLSQCLGLYAGTLSIDGPYLFHLPNGGLRVISVDSSRTMQDTILSSIPKDFSMPVVANNGTYLFDVTPHPISRQAWKSKAFDEQLVISDPHGNLECFVSVLKANKVIDRDYNWIYGSNHLLINGDVFDRGEDVLPIFWLIYKLEQEAQEAGGQVSFLLGNHEAMVLSGDLRYVKDKYKSLADQLNIPYNDLFSLDTELGRWLATRNTIQITGDFLFVHAGLGEAFLEKNLDVAKVNAEISQTLFLNKQQRNENSELTGFLQGSNGPLWYRGMVRNDSQYDPLYIDDLEKILKSYDVKHIVVGHTIFPDIRTFYDKKVITVNVDNQKNFDKVLGRGICIKKDKIYVISDKGILHEL